MATDGDIDFRTYTREQLDGAVARMDHQRYPINSRNLVTEYQRRRVAERQATELAAKSGAVATLDNMLSVPWTFAIRFEPNAGPSTWLAPSRNDFHLIGSGNVQVDDRLVRLTGRRFSVLFGMPFIRTEELGLQFVINVEVDGAAVRFELRVPGEKVSGLTMWLPSAADAEELSKSLPVDRTPDFTPQLARHVEFERSLIAQSPKVPVTYGLVIICICAYLATAIGTNQLLGFDGPSLVRLGSNFGPYTTGGDWWRLLTSLFLHAGLIHLAFNMWALASFGPLVERLYGGVSYGLIYVTAGIAGALTSVTWNPGVNSVGASGAIFGILGALIAAQMRSDESFPKSVVRPLRNSSLIFTGCALFAGILSSKVDNAAHLGGVSAGFLLGLAAMRPITGESSYSRSDLRRFIQLVPVAALVLAAGFWFAQRAAASMVGEELYQRTAHWLGVRERIVNSKFNAALSRDSNEKQNHSALIEALERDVIPFWREAGDRLAAIQLSSNSPDSSTLEILQDLSDGRADAYQLLDDGLRKKDPKEIARAGQDLRQVEQTANDRRRTGQ